jgi:hypothetical protein
MNIRTRYHRLLTTVICMWMLAVGWTPLEGQNSQTVQPLIAELQTNPVTLHRKGDTILVSLNIHKMRLSQALGLFASAANIGISFRSHDYLDRDVSVVVKEVPFYDAVYALLGDSEVKLELSENGRVLIIHGEDQHGSPVTASQDGRGQLAGRVRDAVTGEPLIGVTIVLQNTVVGAATNTNGDYSLAGLPSGTQTFVIRYLGYTTRTVQIDILANQTVTFDVLMQPDTIQGEEVIVYTQALGQAMAIRQQIGSNTIVNVVSEARLQELPDANAAESLGRLPGVSLIRDAGEGQRVAIRGLSPRYNTITFDGAKVPSTDESGRAVDLNMISSEMLSGIEVFKAITPDMDADAIGGSVNFVFAPVPDGPRARMNLRSGYSSHINALGAYNANLNVSKRFFNKVLGVGLSADYQQHDRSSDVFNGSYLVLRDPREGEEFAPMAITNVGLQDRREVRERYGLGIMSDVKLPNGTIRFNNFASRLDRDIYDIIRSFNAEERRQDWNIDDRQIITDVLSSRLSGKHRFGMFEADWMLSRNISIQDVQYGYSLQFREFSAFDNSLDVTGDPTLVPLAARNDLANTRFQLSQMEKGKNTELDYSAQLDLQYSFRLGSMVAGRVKTGGKYTQKDRFRASDQWRIRDWDYRIITQNENRDWLLTNVGRLNILNFLDPDYYRDDFLDGRYVLDTGISRTLMRDLWKKHAAAHRPSVGIRFRDQNVVERFSAAYIMSQITVGQKLMILPGIRLEHENSNYTAVKGTITGNYDDEGSLADTTANRVKTFWFPMVQIRYHVTSWLDVRMARTETLARPNFSELLPYERIGSGDNAFLRRGNPFLEPARSTNYDIMMSVYGNRIGLFAVGLFHKTINNLIYNRTVITIKPEIYDLPSYMRGWNLFEPFNNPYETQLRGVEVEWQSNLTFLPAPFNGLVINANFSRIWSETQYPVFQLQRTLQGLVGIDTFRVAPMINQPDHIGNISLGYDYRGFSGRISVLYQGSTLRAVGIRQEPIRLLTITYDMTRRFASGFAKNWTWF